MSIQDILDGLESLLEQEKSSTLLQCDYLTALSSNKEIHREAIAYWVYRVVDHCSFHRETAELAIRYLDRVLLSRCQIAKEIINHYSAFELLSITSLYLAIKMNEEKQKHLRVDDILSLSRGNLTKNDVLHMEAMILRIIDWRVLIPTAAVSLSYNDLKCDGIHLILGFQQYMHHIKLWVQAHGSLFHSDRFNYIFTCAIYQVELSMAEYTLAIEKPSKIVVGAIRNACDSLPHTFQSSAEKMEFNKLINDLQLIQDDTQLKNVQDQLLNCVLNHSMNIAIHNESVKSKKPKRMSSPVSIMLH